MLSASDPGLSPLNLAIRLSLFYAGYFLVAGVLFPFLPLLLEARGMTPLQISLLMALALWLPVIRVNRSLSAPWPHWW